MKAGKEGRVPIFLTSLLLMGHDLCLSLFFGKLVRPAGGGTSVQLVSHLLRCELCNAKHVGTFNHVGCHSKRKRDL